MVGASGIVGRGVDLKMEHRGDRADLKTSCQGTQGAEAWAVSLGQQQASKDAGGAVSQEMVCRARHC